MKHVKTISWQFYTSDDNKSTLTFLNLLLVLHMQTYIYKLKLKWNIVAYYMLRLYGASVCTAVVYVHTVN